MAVTLDEATQRLLQRELDRGDFADANELIAHALHLVHAEAAGHPSSSEMEDWLTRNREAIRADIGEGLAAEARGESYSLEEVVAFLDEHRARRSQAA